MWRASRGARADRAAGARGRPADFEPVAFAAVGLGADAACFHFHDPELLPVGAVLKLCGRRVIYDVHEHFPLVAMVRPWVPERLRRPLARLVDWGERAIARYFVTAVVGVVEEQGDRFASRPFAVVKNYPRLEWYSPGCGELGPCALVHIGSLSEDRGGLFLLEIMRRTGQDPSAGSPLERRGVSLAGVAGAVLRSSGASGGWKSRYATVKSACHTTNWGRRLPRARLAWCQGRSRPRIWPPSCRPSSLNT